MQPWVIRPSRSTWVASRTTRPAPEFASMPRWVMCHSLATPSSAEYWHIGATTMRFGKVRSASFIGENKTLDIVVSYRLGEENNQERGAKGSIGAHAPLRFGFWITRQEAESPVRPMSNRTKGLIRPARDRE